MTITFLLPRTDYSQQEYYDLLDGILITAGFQDEGLTSVNEHSFRKYSGDSAVFQPLLFENTAIPTNEGMPLAIYTEAEVDEETTMLMAGYGIFFTKLLDVNTEALNQFCISSLHLPLLAKICPNGVKASRRVIEELSYYKFLERGGGYGCDLRDWFAAEWEADGKLNDLLNKLS